MAALVKRHLVRADERMGERIYKPTYDRLLEPARTSDRSPALTHQQCAKDRLSMVEDALRQGEFTLAARHGEQALAAMGNDNFERAKAESLLGDVAYERGDLEQAISRYTRAAQGFDTVGAATTVGPLLTAIGRLRLTQGQPSEAVRELRAAMARAPTDLLIQTELAWALWHGGHPEAAVGVLDGVLNKEGNNTEALLGRGQILAGLGRAHDALRDLDRARPLRSPYAKIAHALALAQTGSMDRAQNELAAAMAGAGGHGPVLLYAARVEELSGRMRSAAKLAGRAISAAAPALPRHLERDAQRLAHGL
jgi:tetratricopeptide (TPR) repeat protein